LSFIEVAVLSFFWLAVLSIILFIKTTFSHRTPLISTPDSLGIPFERVSFRATDGMLLSGWKMTSDLKNPWIIACHGMGTNRDGLLGIATKLLKAKYNVLLFDFRGHGQSNGKTISFGWQEKRDLEGAIAFLGSQPEVSDSPYGVYGISMGAAVAIMVAAYDERIKAVVADGSFSRLEESIAVHMRLFYKITRMPFIWFVNIGYFLRFGVHTNRVSPIDCIDKISPRAVLIIQGESDRMTPPNGGKMLFEKAKEPKQLWFAREADHLEGIELYPQEYCSRVVDFFDSNLKT
jgi:fermentation-respiration switch protein FrsA (DUF1100 family)